MSEPAAKDTLVKIREWIDTEGREPDKDGYYDWPSPPEYTEYRVVGQMRADVLARLGRTVDDPCEVRLIEGVIEGGWSEYTVEFDYPLEVWVDDAGQSQRVFDHDGYNKGLPAFLCWLEG